MSAPHPSGGIEELLATIDSAWADADRRRPRRLRPVSGVVCPGAVAERPDPPDAPEAPEPEESTDLFGFLAPRDPDPRDEPHPRYPGPSEGG
ncbi:hypothetical protein AB0M43_00670 [Longispora sp. NPDC051575]|uniref:hypothetical protein n=1 Tax=Longispora sp. NPDC051575 TaxID=3154943 RepID=UPI003421C2F2